MSIILVYTGIYQYNFTLKSLYWYLASCWRFNESMEILIIYRIIDRRLVKHLVANFAVKVTKQGCLSLCHFATDSA